MFDVFYTFMGINPFVGNKDGNNEVITTYFLSLYGVDAATTVDTTYELHIYRNIGVTTLEATARRGIVHSLLVC